MTRTHIWRGFMTMLIGLALCSFKGYAASRILFTTGLPIGATITLTISAEGEVSAKGLTGVIQTDGKSHDYIIESAQVTLLGAITRISLSGQQLTQLDIRQAKELTELSCDYNQLTELNVAYSTSLLRLDCSYNQIERIDLPKQSALKELLLRSNWVKGLAVDRCPELVLLDYADNYYPSSIDLSKCPKLQILHLERNKLRAIDLKNNLALQELSCDENELSSLDLAHLVALERLSVALNYKLRELRLGEHPQLRELDLFSTQVTSLDLASYPLLETLSCAYCQLTSLDLSHSKQLKTLICGKNPIKGIDVTHNPLLEKLSCNDLEIETIDLSQNPLLTSIRINHNSLSQLDLSAQEGLKTLDVSNNLLGILDLTSLTQLDELFCSDNRLSAISLPPHSNLHLIEIYNNQIKEPEMAKIIASLPDRTELPRGTVKVVDTRSTLEGNVCTMAQVAQAQARYWRVVDYASFAHLGDGLDYRGSDAPTMGDGLVKLTFDKESGPVTLTVEMLGELQSSGTTQPIENQKDPMSYTLDTHEVIIRGDIYRLAVKGAALKEIELSNCRYLREIELQNYQPAKLSLAELPNLLSLTVSNNHLTQLQLSHTPLLTYLACYGNKLSVEEALRLIESLPQRHIAEEATLLWLNTKGESEDNAFEQQLVNVAHAKGWEMSDYQGGDKGALGSPISFPLANHPMATPREKTMLQVHLTLDCLQITAASHTPVALYDLSGQLVRQLETDAEGQCQIRLTSLTNGLYIIATPEEAVKCAIP